MNEKDYAKAQADAQYESIVEMVAAVNVDYDRLEALREEKAALQDAVSTAETQEDAEKYEIDLDAWEFDNGQELEELEAAAGDCENQSAAIDRIQEDPLSIEVRSDWHAPGDTDGNSPSEFQILLCCGGPAVRIRGEIGNYGQPSRAWMEFQDWGTPWTEYFSASQETLLAYCSNFYFGG